MLERVENELVPFLSFHVHRGTDLATDTLPHLVESEGTLLSSASLPQQNMTPVVWLQPRVDRDPVPVQQRQHTRFSSIEVVWAPDVENSVLHLLQSLNNGFDVCWFAGGWRPRGLQRGRRPSSEACTPSRVLSCSCQICRFLYMPPPSSRRASS